MNGMDFDAEVIGVRIDSRDGQTLRHSTRSYSFR
jgi:hypothetical protein